MKNSIVFIILFAFVARPLFYVGHYAYYVTYLNYIIENYCINTDKPAMNCDGKCFLAQQIKIGEQKTEQDALSEVLSAFFPVFYSPSLKTVVSNNIMPPKRKQQYWYLNTYQYLENHSTIKPPAA